MLTYLFVSSNMLNSTQKILHNARMAEQGRTPRDPLKESIALELDMINILYVLHVLFP